MSEFRSKPFQPNKIHNSKPRFLGNYYGRHDGYDGAVFDPNYPCKTITHSIGGVACVIVESNKYKNGSHRTGEEAAKSV